MTAFFSRRSLNNANKIRLIQIRILWMQRKLQIQIHTCETESEEKNVRLTVDTAG